MKVLLSTIALLALTTTVVSTSRASMLENRPMNSWPFLSEHAFEEVPQDHWSYSALNKLILVSQLDESHIPKPDHLFTRHEFASVLWYCDGALDPTERALAKDLSVALNYEYALEMMGIASKPMSNERLSWQDKKELAAFDELVKRNRSEFTPDQWSDFLQQGAKVPVRTGIRLVIKDDHPLVALPNANPRFRRPELNK